MKRDGEQGWEMVWAAIRLGVVSCLLMFVSFTPKLFGQSKILYCVVLISISVLELAMVYALVRKFFGKKK